MQVIASLKNLRIAPRKVRLIAGLIRGLDVAKAKTQLHFLVKKTAEPMEKLLDSALANAKHNFKLNPADLYISEIYVNEGAVLKRGRSRARGRVFPIRKKTSHIHLTLSQKKDKQQRASGKKERSVSRKAAEAMKELGAPATAAKGQTNPPAGGAKPIRSSGKEAPARKPSGGAKRLTGLARRAFNIKTDK
ncbi:50S ribosomal protein L22 [Candidatus Azambacteria bacterium RIFCSPHIGHO2_02_FULL_52_12]|uniref:Large ribosomal subunit protein uL22 n=1 Tax=Candidatus Azambacteria bacterium RIFCSPLOWO2_01_FULL_46_25 TaxID=1797298 RepID=A0A1F5BU67_9BACT|nr:MAG: 50S ribosomal protein L22 [Candidatus Azambacteria bacterium RIFCSPHIGHO2_02_FULL_52_12]OGD34138.1 MAG: 50S ribosomal protein L22 [Candidatus Azambacteria bacterium RIFCSPLOWO2_01_FULL_46_25]OGD36737.1 MAG: 50S ribosomal protein L22 [Candidatus Azambacteria bacterium RIFCSPHIGHO2_01_FULL_51_74]